MPILRNEDPVGLLGVVSKGLEAELATDETIGSPTGMRIVFLDTLRFIAAAAVVFQHVVERQGSWGQAVVAALSPGVFGVVLFFIISGFVIPMAAKRGLDLRKFAIRRVFRIYPLVLVTFAVLGLCSALDLLPNAAEIRGATPGDWLANLLLVQDYVGARPLWGLTWTLSLEIAWYVIFALSVMLIGPRFDRWLSLAAPAVLILLLVASVASDHRLPLARLGMIYAAILGCRIYRFRTGLVSLRRVVLDLAVFISVMAASNFVGFGYFAHPNITLNQALYPWIAAPVLFGLVALVPRIRESRVVNGAVVAWLGAISFSTYLLHPFAMYIAEASGSSSAAITLVILITLVLSAAGYYLVEVPGQKLGQRMT